MRFQLRKPGRGDNAAGDQDERANRPTPISAARLLAAPKLALRGQASATDARAERLMRQLREEVDRLKGAVRSRISTPELLDVSPQAAAANPEAAAEIDPAILVRALIAAAATEQELRSKLASREAEVSALRHQLTRLREDAARDAGRLETLEEVLAVLHANLEDLRGARTFMSEPAPPQLPKGGKKR